MWNVRPLLQGSLCISLVIPGSPDNVLSELAVVVRHFVITMRLTVCLSVKVLMRWRALTEQWSGFNACRTPRLEYRPWAYFRTGLPDIRCPSLAELKKTIVLTSS